MHDDVFVVVIVVGITVADEGNTSAKTRCADSAPALIYHFELIYLNVNADGVDSATLRVLPFLFVSHF